MGFQTFFADVVGMAADIEVVAKEVLAAVHVREHSAVTCGVLLDFEEQRVAAGTPLDGCGNNGRLPDLAGASRLQVELDLDDIAVVTATGMNLQQAVELA